jgi:hypothetical protein
MKQEQMQLLMIKGAISDLDSAQQERVSIAAQAIRDVVAKAGEVGLVALGLVTAEEVAK